MVAQRRWNVLLNNGIDVELPETNAEAALHHLVALDQDKKLSVARYHLVDLRIPDRVTVRLVRRRRAGARCSAERRGQKKKKGGNA